MYSLAPSFHNVKISWSNINTKKIRLRIRKNGFSKWKTDISNPGSTGNVTGTNLDCGKTYRFKAKEKKRHSFKPFPNSKWKWLKNIEIVWYAWSTVANKKFTTLQPSGIPSSQTPPSTCPGNCLAGCFHKDVLVKGFEYPQVDPELEYGKSKPIYMVPPISQSEFHPVKEAFNDTQFQNDFYSNLSVKYGSDFLLQTFWKKTPASHYLYPRGSTSPDSIFFVNGLGTNIDKLSNQRKYLENFFGVDIKPIWNVNESAPKMVREVSAWYAWLNHSDAELLTGIPLGDGTKESVYEIINVAGLILHRLSKGQETKIIGTSQGNLIIATAIRLLYLLEYENPTLQNEVRNYLKTKMSFLSIGCVIPSSNLPFLKNSLKMFENHGSEHDAFSVYASDMNNQTLPWIFTLANKTLWGKNKSKNRKNIAAWIYGIVGSLAFGLFAGAWAVYTFTSVILNIIGVPAYYNVYLLAGTPFAIPFVIAYIIHFSLLTKRSFDAHSLNKQYVTDGTRHVTKNIF